MESNENKKIFSVVIPVYQNEGSLTVAIPLMLSVIEKIEAYKTEIILVDDGSTDNSYEIIKKYCTSHPEIIRGVKLTKNFGQVSAIYAGLQIAKGHCTGIISADMQDPFELFTEMLKIWEKGTKLVIAERQNREDPLLQKVFSFLYFRLVNMFAVRDYPYGGFDFCLMDREIVNILRTMEEKNTHLSVLIFSLGFSHEIILYTRKKRIYGRSQWTFAKKFKLFIDTFVSFSYTPIRFMSLTGIIVFFLSLTYAIYISVQKLLHPEGYIGWTSIACLITMFGGLIMFTLGIIGEYLWRILDEVRKRPVYIIDEVLTDERQDTGSFNK
ncbi:MAG: glycosyltransferase family 2 protein [Nitrospirae bacterium YQR-1]